MNDASKNKLKRRMESWEQLERLGLVRFVLWGGLYLAYVSWVLGSWFTTSLNSPFLIFMIVMYPVGLIVSLGIWQLGMWCYAKDKKRFIHSS